MEAVLRIGERYLGNWFAVRWVDDIHDFAAVRFNECAIDVVCRDCLHRASPFENGLGSERGDIASFSCVSEPPNFETVGDSVDKAISGLLHVPDGE